MFLLFNEALICRSSNSIIFIKKEKHLNNKGKDCGKWHQYYKIDNMRGTIYFIRGNVRF